VLLDQIIYLEVIKKYGPAVLSVIGGKLSYDDQKRINDIVMGVYNKYNVGTELKGLQYRTGQGLASLPVFRRQKTIRFSNNCNCSTKNSC
jgi:hypothetical protein